MTNKKKLIVKNATENCEYEFDKTENVILDPYGKDENECTTFGEMVDHHIRTTPNITTITIDVKNDTMITNYDD
jgi:hypothetical protein